ncbi:RING/U-box superfamily protein [Artemisia annua]|uniref:RING/U-box superfamily protein n=1 Tax=Artemisia annua TaxID=35608 RepID=A0A2U1LFY2_ARTAN|nr:RING/U-box superfamily protein [Artemisia annua]
MSLGIQCHRGTASLTEKRVGPTSSLGIIDGETIPVEASPANIPQRHVTGERYPKRHFAWKRPEFSLGKGVEYLRAYGTWKLGVIHGSVEVDIIGVFSGEVVGSLVDVASIQVDGADFDGNDPGNECVTCLSEPGGTTLLPCHHKVDKRMSC